MPSTPLSGCGHECRGMHPAKNVQSQMHMNKNIQQR